MPVLTQVPCDMFSDTVCKKCKDFAKCPAGQYKKGCKRDAKCLPCPDDAPAGYYRKDCAGFSEGAIEKCADCPDGEHSVGCGFLSEGTCATCKNCGEGLFLAGCGGVEEGMCEACLSGEDALGGVPKDHWKKGCDGRSPGEIEPCAQCHDGEWKKNCRGLNEGECIPCVDCEQANFFLEGCAYTSEGECKTCQSPEHDCGDFKYLV